MSQEHFCIAFRFESGALGIACKRQGSFAMQLIEGKPGDRMVAKDAFLFDSVEAAQGYIDDLKAHPEGKKLFDHFEGRCHIIPAREILVH